MDWPLQNWKGVTEYQLAGTQNLQQQNASASWHANAPVHTPPTPSLHTNYAARMETRSESEHQTR